MSSFGSQLPLVASEEIGAISPLPVASKFSPAVDSAPVAAKKGGRLEFLDAVRGLAASAVIIEHCCEKFFPEYPHWSVQHFSFGVFGVATFFLVSGFIIPVSLERYGSLIKFWEARIFRLFPIYWISLAVVLLLSCLGLATLPAAFYVHPATLLLVNAAMLQSFVGVQNLMGVAWTLSLELIFYSLCSVIYLSGFLSRSALWAWVAVAANLLLSVVAGFVFHRSLPAGQMALLVCAFAGTLVYRLSKGQVKPKVVLQIAPLLVISLLASFWFRFARYVSADPGERSTFLCVACSFLGAYALFMFCFVMRRFQFPPFFLWLGRISYSLYLFHGAILVLVPTGNAPLLRMLLVYLLSIALAATTFRYIEQPAVAIHQQRVKRLEARRLSART